MVFEQIYGSNQVRKQRLDCYEDFFYDLYYSDGKNIYSKCINKILSDRNRVSINFKLLLKFYLYVLLFGWLQQYQWLEIGFLK